MLHAGGDLRGEGEERALELLELRIERAAALRAGARQAQRADEFIDLAAGLDARRAFRQRLAAERARGAAIADARGDGVGVFHVVAGREPGCGVSSSASETGNGSLAR